MFLCLCADIMTTLPKQHDLTRIGVLANTGYITEWFIGWPL